MGAKREESLSDMVVMSGTNWLKNGNKTATEWLQCMSNLVSISAQNVHIMVTKTAAKRHQNG